MWTSVLGFFVKTAVGRFISRWIFLPMLKRACSYLGKKLASLYKKIPNGK
jgi:hypothetical protein